MVLGGLGGGGRIEEKVEDGFQDTRPSSEGTALFKDVDLRPNKLRVQILCDTVQGRMSCLLTNPKPLI